MHKINFTKDYVYTIFGISSGMANTTRAIVKFTGTYHNDRPVFKDATASRSRKMFMIPINKDTLIFAGNAIPFTTDTDAPAVMRSTGFTSRVFRGNACINLVGDIDTIRDFCTTKNLNPDFTSFDSILHYTPDNCNDSDFDGVPVFPDYPTSHAVVMRVREAAAAMPV